MSLEIEYDDGLEIAHATRVRQHGDVVERAVQSVGNMQINLKKDHASFEDGLMSMEETLKLLKVSKVTIHNWKKKGIIKSHKMGRKLYFKRDELMEAVKRQKYSI